MRNISSSNLVKLMKYIQFKDKLYIIFNYVTILFNKTDHSRTSIINYILLFDSIKIFKEIEYAKVYLCYDIIPLI